MTQIDYSQINGLYPFMALILTLVIIPIAKEAYQWLNKRKKKKNGDYVDMKQEIKKISENQTSLNAKFDEHLRVENECKKETNDRLSNLELQTMGNQILTLMHFKPAEEITIENLCQKYISKGGNGYIKSMYEDWKHSAKNPAIKRTSKKAV